MLNKNDLTIIIPLHKFDAGVKEILDEALSTVEGYKVIMSVPTGLKKELKAYKDINIFEHEGGSSFSELVNDGVSHVESEWFSILEYDDAFLNKWFDAFAYYQEYHKEYNFFLPLNDLYDMSTATDGKEPDFLGNGNEAVWSSGFAEELGIIGPRECENFFDYYIPGGFIKKSVWDEYGGLKESIKLTFWYEFMLRMTQKGEKFFVIPKVGYAHGLNRPGSLMLEYKDSIDREESEFWFKTAKKESFYKEDRKKTYVKKIKEETKEEENK